MEFKARLRAADLLLADMDRVLAALKTRAFEHKNTVRIGRSHGIHAEPVTFGLKLAQAYAEFDRNRARLVAARAEVAAWRERFSQAQTLNAPRIATVREQIAAPAPVAGQSVADLAARIAGAKTDALIDQAIAQIDGKLN